MWCLVLVATLNFLSNSWLPVKQHNRHDLDDLSIIIETGARIMVKTRVFWTRCIYDLIKMRRKPTVTAVAVGSYTWIFMSMSRLGNSLPLPCSFTLSTKSVNIFTTTGGNWKLLAFRCVQPASLGWHHNSRVLLLLPVLLLANSNRHANQRQIRARAARRPRANPT